MTDTKSDADNVDNATGGNAGGDSTTETTKTGDTATQDTKKDTETTGNGDPVTREEFDALYRRMQAADRRATAAEKKLDDADKAKLGELERAKLEAEEAKTARDKASDELKAAKLQNAFLADKTSWHDSDDAFTILQRDFMEGVEINDQGKVVGMDTAIKALAKKKPHLVKTETTSEATGSGHNGKRKGEGDAVNKSAMKSRFPAAFPTY